MTSTIRLTQEKVAVIDAEDFERVSSFRWYASLESSRTKWYAKRHRRVTDDPRWRAAKVRLHHFILGVPPSELPEGHVVDHINGDGLDCRKSNLEIVTAKENLYRTKNWMGRVPVEEPCL